MPGQGSFVFIQAKLRFSNTVSKDDINDCVDIIQQTRIQEAMQDKSKPTDKLGSIFSIIKEMCLYSRMGGVDGDLLLKRVISRGYSHDDLREVI